LSPKLTSTTIAPRKRPALGQVPHSAPASPPTITLSGARISSREIRVCDRQSSPTAGRCACVLAIHRLIDVSRCADLEESSWARRPDKKRPPARSKCGFQTKLSGTNLKIVPSGYPPAKGQSRGARDIEGMGRAQLGAKHANPPRAASDHKVNRLLQAPVGTDTILPDCPRAFEFVKNEMIVRLMCARFPRGGTRARAGNRLIPLPTRSRALRRRSARRPPEDAFLADAPRRPVRSIRPPTSRSRICASARTNAAQQSSKKCALVSCGLRGYMERIFFDGGGGA